MGIADDSYSLEQLKKSPSEIAQYAETVLRLVKEVDQRPVQKEIQRIKSQYHIDHYYVLRGSQRVGVVKIFQGNYFYLGVEEYVDEDEIVNIIGVIEENVGGWRLSRIESTLHSRFYDIAISMGYELEFSRIKMVLELDNATNLEDEDGLITRTYQRGDLSHLIDMASDAYRDSMDEQIGVFSGGMANSAISSILKGSYGKFKEDLTPIIVAEDSNYIEGASMTTLAEGNPFVVLIGVRRAEQGKGYGRKLLSWVIRQSIAKGYDELRLWVTVGNKAAYNLYQSVGFREITRIHSMYREL